MQKFARQMDYLHIKQDNYMQIREIIWQNF